MDFAKLAQLAKIQSEFEEKEPTGALAGIVEETSDDKGIYIAIDDETEEIPDDGYAVNSEVDEQPTAKDNEAVSLDEILAQCFTDEKAYNIEIERLLSYHSPVFSACDDVSELKSSIARIGITEPLLVKSVSNGEYEILSGNNRRKAAEELLWTKVPCKIADNEKLTPETEKKIIVECNKDRLSELKHLSEQIRVAETLGKETASKLLMITDERAELCSRLSALEQDFLTMLDNLKLDEKAAEALTVLNEKQQKQVLSVLAQHPEYRITIANASELSCCKRFTTDSISKILKPKPPVNVAIAAEVISEYMGDKTAEEISEIVTAAIKFYFQ